MKNISKSMIYFNLAIVLAAGLFLAACTSEYQPQPRGIGTDPSELKRSPCACLQVQPLPGLPDWLIS